MANLDEIGVGVSGSNDAAVEKVVDRQVADGGWARVPVEVIVDRRVKGTALRVYALMAAALRYTGTVSIGMRLISRKTGIAVRNVARAIKELEAAGHIKTVPKDRGYRGSYILTAKVFHEKQGKANLKAFSSEGRLVQVAINEADPHGTPHFPAEEWR